MATVEIMALNSYRVGNKPSSFVSGVGSESTKGVGEVDLVPMINVVFLLLIFFMVVGVFKATTDNNLVLPTTQVNPIAQEQSSEPQLVINRRGEISIDGQGVERVDVLGVLQKLNNAQPLLIQADANAPANDIVFVLRLASDVGFDSAGLQTTQISLSSQQ